MKLEPLAAAERQALDAACRRLAARAAELDVTLALGGDPRDLEALQPLLAAGRLGAEDTAGLGALFGTVLERSLGLAWVEVTDEEGREPALRYRDSDVLFYPRRLIARQLVQAPGFELAGLLGHVKEYLDNLQRYVFRKAAGRQAVPAGDDLAAGHGRQPGS